MAEKPDVTEIPRTLRNLAALFRAALRVGSVARGEVRCGGGSETTGEAARSTKTKAASDTRRRLRQILLYSSWSSVLSIHQQVMKVGRRLSDDEARRNGSGTRTSGA